MKNTALVINSKGSVGKTPISFNLAYDLDMNIIFLLPFEKGFGIMQKLNFKRFFIKDFFINSLGKY